MLLQVLLDQVVGRLFGLAELRDDERKSVSQTLQLIGSFLQTTGQRRALVPPNLNPSQLQVQAEPTENARVKNALPQRSPAPRLALFHPELNQRPELSHFWCEPLKRILRRFLSQPYSDT